MTGKPERLLSMQQTTERYLSLMEVYPLELWEMQEIRDNFIRQMDLGMGPEPESLAMIPSQLGELRKENLKEGDKALVVDAGGSGLKIGVFQVTDGKIVLQGENKEINFSKTHWEGEDFFDFIADQIREQKINLEDMKGISFIFSFPGAAEKTSKGVDVTGKDKLTKDWTINGLEKGGPVGEQLINALRRKYTKEEDWLSGLSLAVMNDTVATLYAHPEALIGGVVGTGFNLAVMLDGMVRNIEAGGYASKYLTPTWLTQVFDSFTENEGKQLAEKQISGIGVGGQLKEFIRGLANLHILDGEWFGHLKNIDSRLASHILDAGQEVDYVHQLLKDRELKDWERDLLTPVCEQLRERSAQILASFLAALAEKVDQDSLTIPIDGSFFWKTPGYRQRLIEHLKELDPDPKRTYNFVGENERLGAVGAARVVLSFGES